MATNRKHVRIMRITGELNMSGPAFHAVLLTRKLSAPEYESLLVCGNPTDDMLNYARENGVEPRIFRELDYDIPWLLHLNSIWKLYRLMREYQPDVVHTHTMKSGFLGRIAAKLAGVPVIVHTFHEYPFYGYFSRERTIRFVWIERIAARISDSIIALTESLRTKLVDRYRIARRSRITVLPIGLDLRTFAATKRHHGTFRVAWNIPSDVPLIGIIGQLIAVKNHVLFIEAAAIVRDVLPDSRFVIVGGGDLGEEIEALVRAKGLGDCVIFTGPQKDVALIYGDLDVSVISSLNEGTPLPVIESLATGCPVVATSVGGLPDLLDGGRLGRLVASNDADALAAAIIDTVKNPPDVKQAQKAMLDRYAIERLVRDLDGLYRGILLAKGHTSL